MKSVNIICPYCKCVYDPELDDIEYVYFGESENYTEIKCEECNNVFKCYMKTIFDTEKFKKEN